ncbi:MAG: tripartite tricarboxylate transporter substrate binding protein [Burkholderiales bacterium]|nr:tripartite tricarboxylate transporter substrate binding protein [Burkholderiales bacterium]
MNPFSSTRSLAIGTCLAAGIAMIPGAASGQAYPNRTISIIVAFGAAGVTDTLSRTIAKNLSERLKVPVIVENRPGANQIVGIQQLRSRPADGYTLYTGTGSSLAQNPGIRKDLPYDPLKDFEPIAMLGVQAGVISVAPGSPAKSLRELIDHARKNPGRLNFGSQGVGSASHLATEVFMARTGTSMVHIPLKSDSDIGVELSEGRIDFSFMTPQFSVPLARTGKQRILAVTSVNRLPFLPDLPSLKEAEIPELEDLDPFTFYGLVAAAGTPPEVVRRLNETVNAILQSAEVAAQMRDTFRVEPRAQTPEAFRKFLQDELAKWTAIGARVKVDTR